MPDERPRAPDLLRDYLADRDILCEGCNYNLRGATGVQCPECGTVIPRPPADFIARASADPVTLRLACEDCGYCVTGIDAACCPECGSTSLKQYRGEPPRFRLKRRFPPVVIIVLTAFGALILLATFANAFTASARRVTTGTPWLGVWLSAIPIVIGASWMLARRAIARLEPGERAGLAVILGLISLASILAALRTLA